MSIGRDSSYVLGLSKEVDLYGAILLTWARMHATGEPILLPPSPGSAYDAIRENPKELRKFAETIKMIV